jgi:hypothetical protein
MSIVGCGRDDYISVTMNYISVTSNFPQSTWSSLYLCLTVVLLRIGEHVEHKSFVIATLQHHNFYLGYDWLQQHNPSTDWSNFRIKFDRCPTECGSHSLQEQVIHKSFRAPKNLVSLYSFVPPRINVSTELAIQRERQCCRCAMSTLERGTQTSQED